MMKLDFFLITPLIIKIRAGTCMSPDYAIKNISLQSHRVNGHQLFGQHLPVVEMKMSFLCITFYCPKMKLKFTTNIGH